MRRQPHWFQMGHDGSPLHYEASNRFDAFTYNLALVSRVCVIESFSSVHKKMFYYSNPAQVVDPKHLIVLAGLHSIKALPKKVIRVKRVIPVSQVEVVFA